MGEAVVVMFCQWNHSFGVTGSSEGRVPRSTGTWGKLGLHERTVLRLNLDLAQQPLFQKNWIPTTFSSQSIVAKAREELLAEEHGAAESSRADLPFTAPEGEHRVTAPHSPPHLLPPRLGTLPSGAGGAGGTAFTPEPYPRLPLPEEQPYPRLPLPEEQPYPRLPLPEEQPYPRLPLPEEQPNPRLPLPEEQPSPRTRALPQATPVFQARSTPSERVVSPAGDPVIQARSPPQPEENSRARPPPQVSGRSAVSSALGPHLQPALLCVGICAFVVLLLTLSGYCRILQRFC